VVRRRPASLSADAVDGLLAGLLGALVLTETLLSAHARGAALLNLAGVIAFAAPVAVARRRPVAALAPTAAATIVQAWRLTPLNDLVTPFAVLLLLAYRLGAGTGAVRCLIGCAIIAAGATASTLLAPAAVRAEGSIPPVVVLLLLGVAAGSVSRRGLLRARGLDAETAALEDLHEAAERRAVADEQARISRELHDELAHALTVIVLQAGAAQRVWDSDPDAARIAAGAVAEVARGALTHLRSTLAVLSPAAPAPRGIGDLPRLVDLAGGAGLEVALDLDLAEPEDAEIEQLVVRIVQEALTNAARHAGPTRVSLGVRRAGDAIAVRVRDDGPERAAGRPSSRARVDMGPIPSGAGTGLRGLRRRVEARGGTFAAGPCPDGGFLVEALVPTKVALGA
jgi:signal transduction histidine kinase